MIMESDLPTDAKIFILGDSAWAKGINKWKHSFFLKRCIALMVGRERYISQIYISNYRRLTTVDILILHELLNSRGSYSVKCCVSARVGLLKLPSTVMGNGNNFACGKSILKI